MSPAQEPAIALAEVGLMVTNCNTGALLPQAVKAKMHTNAVAQQSQMTGNSSHDASSAQERENN